MVAWYVPNALINADLLTLRSISGVYFLCSFGVLVIPSTASRLSGYVRLYGGVMNQNFKQFIYGCILLGGGLYLGYLLGSTNALKVQSQIIASHHLNATSERVSTYVDLLTLLHSNETGKASNNLEKLLAVNLTELSKYSEQPAIRLSPSIMKSIEKAKRYRQQYPLQQ